MPLLGFITFSIALNNITVSYNHSMHHDTVQALGYPTGNPHLCKPKIYLIIVLEYLLKVCLAVCCIRVFYMHKFIYKFPNDFNYQITKGVHYIVHTYIH